MAETTLVDAFDPYSNGASFDPCLLSDDLPLPSEFTDFNLDIDFSIEEFLRSPEHSGNGSSGDGFPHSIGADRVESPDSGCSHESAVTSSDVKQEDENKSDWSLKRKTRSEEPTESQNPKSEDDDDKKKARLMRNRESAQLSRQRKKKYVEELEEKVKSMHSVINDLNTKISYVMAENASLRQQIGGGGNLGQPVVYPPPGMHIPWIPGYALRPHGSHVPVVPIPRLKPQTPAPAQKPKKSESKKAKKVASISILGLIFAMLCFQAIFPAFTIRLGDEGTNSGKRAITSNFNSSNLNSDLNSSEEILSGGKKFQTGESNNSSETLPAMLYVPRNGKHVQINGNLIIHSVLASEKAMANKQEPVKEVKETTSLAVAGYVGPQLNKNSQSSLPDGSFPQWFREGMAGPVLSSGMCTEVFQFDVSPNMGSGIVPATTIDNITNTVLNTTEKNLPPSRLPNKKKWSRRVMYNNAIPLPGKTLENNNTGHFESSDGDKKPASRVVVSVLADPREVAGDGDSVSPKSLSRVFVVVLLDGIKYVTYSCVLPFKSAAHHLVNY